GGVDLADQLRLFRKYRAGEAACGLRRDMTLLEAAGTGGCRRAAGRDPVRRRLEDLPDTPPAEGPARVVVDHHVHQLTRDRPAAEDHTALVAGDELPAVRGSVHADPQSSPCPVHALALRHLASGPPQRPTIGSLRVRSARPSEDDSCHGTLVTMTPRS